LVQVDNEDENQLNQQVIQVNQKFHTEFHVAMRIPIELFVTKRLNKIFPHVQSKFTRII
jgi:hypothetical protein